LIRNGIEIRITEEGETKLSLDENKNGERTSIKLKISRTHEMEDFLAKLNIKPISKIYSYRISYEFDGIDFDIDQFPEIPAFVEIDLGDSTISIDSLLKHLSLENNEVFEGSTIKLYEKYNKDYLSLFSLS
jgi:adenylate cyclase class IV